MKTLSVLAISLLPWLAALDAERPESNAPPPFGDTNKLAPPLDARPWSTNDATASNAPALPPVTNGAPIKLQSAEAVRTSQPSFADGVLIADAILAENRGFHGLLSPQEKVALCLRVWQQRPAQGGAR